MNILNFNGSGGRYKLVSCLLFIISAVFALNANAQLPFDCIAPELPTHNTLVCVPTPWNGRLVVYAHGYVAPQKPLKTYDPDDIDLEAFGPFLFSGFAVATTSYSKNGLAVEQGVNDINELVAFFKNQVAPSPVQKVLLVGVSEGALIVTQLLEQYHETYDGALAIGGPLGGMPYQIQYMGDFRAVFDVYFPGVFPFGVADVPQDAYLQLGVYEPIIAGGMALDLATGGNATRQLFDVTRAAYDKTDPNSYIASTLGVLYYNIVGVHDFNATTPGGSPYGNKRRWYFGSDNDWLLNYTVERVRADRRAQRYLKNYYQPTGNLKDPLVVIHTLRDPIVPFRHEVIYFLRTLFRGNLDKLTVIPVDAYGHENYDPAALLGAFALLVQQVETQ